MEKKAGEISAISGYDKQYRVFANEIYNNLLSNKLRWVEFASQTTGTLDDVLIGLEDTILAYQIKTIESSTLTYNSFSKELRSLYSGWKNLKQKYPNYNIDGRFVTSQQASSNDKIKKYRGKNKPSFVSFYSNLWVKIKEGDLNFEDIPKAWVDVVLDLKNTCEAENENELLLFIKSFSIDFAFNFSEEKTFHDDYTSKKRKEDIAKITSSIFEVVASKGNRKLNKEELLLEFGLAFRYSTHFKHSFFVDEDHYQPLKESISKLNQIILKKSKGFIALVGNAGSGKSTMLTKWLQNREENILKYYAYVNQEMNYESGYRGEARYFFQDILTQIRDLQATFQDRIPSDNLEDLRRHFNQELKKLSYNEHKTFIIVDGLDHIEREQKVDTSLIEILPVPEEIPENIFFILGSRTIENLENLNPRIFMNIRDDERIIAIEPLNRTQVQKLIISHNLQLSETLLDELVKKTQGHPLFLRYTVEELLSAKEENYPRIISQKIFNGDIYKEYEIFWKKHEDEDGFIHLLGIMSRFRYSYVDTSLLNKFVKERSEAKKVKKIAEHYFYKQDNIWQFFHNSFKEFIWEKTSSNIFSGTFDKELDENYHSEIAEKIRNIQNDYHWNVIYHLYKAKRFDDLIKIISPEYFRKQWFNYRQTKYLLEDIYLGSSAAYHLDRVDEMISCFFSAFEIKQRLKNFSPSSNYEIYLQLNKIDIANSFIFDNVELLVTKEEALDYAYSIIAKGNKELAYKIFRMAQPSFILHTSKQANTERYLPETLSTQDEVELIIKWARLASNFMSTNEIAQISNQIEIIDERNPDQGRNLTFEVFADLIDEFIEVEAWSKILEAIAVLEGYFEKNDLFYLYFDVVYNSKPGNPASSYCSEVLKNWPIHGETNNRIIKRLAIIEVFFLKNFYKGKELSDRLVIPKLIEDRTHHRDTDFAYYIFDYCRLKYTTNKNFEEDTLNFLPKENNRTLNVFYKAFAELGKSYAHIFLGNAQAGTGFIFWFKEILQLFHCHISDSDYTYAVHENKAVLINSILGISFKVSPEKLKLILTEIEKDWRNYSEYWRIRDIQQILDWLISEKLEKEWVLTQLEKLDNSIFKKGDLSSRIENAKFQIDLWSNLDNIERGEIILQKIMDISLDISDDEDYQLDYIFNWERANRNLRPQDLQFYLDRLEPLEGKSVRIRDLVLDVFQESLPHKNGFEIYEYLLFNGLASFGDSSEILLSYMVRNQPHLKTLFTKIYTRLVINFDSAYNGRSNYLKALFQLELSIQDIRHLIKEINIHSIQEHKNSYLKKIKNYAVEKGLAINLKDINIIEKKSAESYSSSLKLNSGVEISDSEVMNRVSSFEELKALINEEERENSYYNWSGVIKHLVSLDRLSLENVSEILRIKELDWKDLYEVGDTFLQKGQSEAAQFLFYKALEKSKSYGWVKRFDGGSKIKTYQNLKMVESGGKASEMAFHDFAHEKDPPYLHVLGDLTNILSLFDKDLNISSINSTIQEYKEQLLKNYPQITDKVKVSGNLSNEELLIKFLTFLTKFPSRFDDIIIEIILEDYVNYKDFTGKFLHDLKKDEQNFTYLKLVSGLSFVDPKIVQDEIEDLLQLLNHERFDFYKIVAEILERNNIDYSQHLKQLTKSLPFTYNMKVHYKPQLVVSEEEQMRRLNETGYLSDTNDPIEIIKLYIDLVELISDRTGFEVVNLAYRIVTLGSKEVLPSWSRELTEKEIRSIYEHRFDLKITYTRPRYQIVWDGLMKTLRELWEVDLISLEFADYIANQFDVGTFFIRSVEKPNFVSSILDKSNYAPSAKKGWVYELNKDYLDKTLKFETSENKYILGEISVLAGLGDGHTSENRQAFIGLYEKPKDRTNLIFSISDKSRIENYQELDVRGIVFFNWLLTINKKRNWLAFNPRIAKMMDLRLSEEGNFRWLDSENQIVVESIYWKSSEEGNTSRNLHSEAGYGWYVVISRKGLLQLKERVLGNSLILHHKRIQRKMVFVQRKFGTYLDEENDIYETFSLKI